MLERPLESLDRRAWPEPARRFAMHMTWSDLAFLHWPVAADALRAHVPRELEIETFDGTAWLGVVPFEMSGVRLRRCIGLPGTTRFPELNVRTYVRHKEKPGVWFFSLDAASRLSVRGARAWFGLPYFDARMVLEKRGEWIHYHSERTHRRAPAARFRARYAPGGAASSSGHATLERFLTSRYCLYSRCRGKLVRAEIDHPSWPLQPARVEIEECAMTDGLGLPLVGTPHALFASRLAVRAWAPQPV